MPFPPLPWRWPRNSSKRLDSLLLMVIIWRVLRCHACGWTWYTISEDNSRKGIEQTSMNSQQFYSYLLLLFVALYVLHLLLDDDEASRDEDEFLDAEGQATTGKPKGNKTRQHTHTHKKKTHHSTGLMPEAARQGRRDSMGRRWMIG